MRDTRKTGDAKAREGKEGRGAMKREVIMPPTQTIFGTKYSTRGFRTIKALRDALVPHQALGEWCVMRETGFSRTGKTFRQYVGVIL